MLCETSEHTLVKFLLISTIFVGKVNVLINVYSNLLFPAHEFQFPQTKGYTIINSACYKRLHKPFTDFFFSLHCILPELRPRHTATCMPCADLRNFNGDSKALSSHKYWEAYGGQCPSFWVLKGERALLGMWSSLILWLNQTCGFSFWQKWFFSTAWHFPWNSPFHKNCPFFKLFKIEGV